MEDDYLSSQEAFSQGGHGQEQDTGVVQVARDKQTWAQRQMVEFTKSIVDANAGGAKDGTSWGDAYNYLQDVMDVAGSGDEVWVSEGTYKPDQGGAGVRSQKAEDRGQRTEDRRQRTEVRGRLTDEGRRMLDARDW